MAGSVNKEKIEFADNDRSKYWIMPMTFGTEQGEFTDYHVVAPNVSIQDAMMGDSFAVCSEAFQARKIAKALNQNS